MRRIGDDSGKNGEKDICEKTFQFFWIQNLHPGPGSRILALGPGPRVLLLDSGSYSVGYLESLIFDHIYFLCIGLAGI